MSPWYEKKNTFTHAHNLCTCCFNVVVFFSFCEQDCHDGVLRKERPLPWCILRAILFQVMHINNGNNLQTCVSRQRGLFHFKTKPVSCKSCVSVAVQGVLPVPQHVLRDSHGAPHPPLRPRQRLRADRVEGAGLPCARVPAYHSQLLLVPHLQTGWRRPSLCLQRPQPLTDTFASLQFHI